MLGANEEARQSAYRALFRQHVEGRLLEDIRNATNKGLALGNERFVADVEAVTGKRLTPGQRGRPLGWRKTKPKQIYRCEPFYFTLTPFIPDPFYSFAQNLLYELNISIFKSN
ncbi:MAG: hypothetical protein ACI88A_005144 [Paraglaciecola sp.]